MKALPLDDLPPEARRKLLAQHGRKRAPRRSKFSKDQVRTYAIRVLSVVADLSPSARERVLAMAGRMNAV
jgi:hypothetical protein